MLGLLLLGEEAVGCHGDSVSSSRVVFVERVAINCNAIYADSIGRNARETTTQAIRNAKS